MRSAHLLAAFAAALLGTSSVLAADLPAAAPAEPAYVEPAATWSGFYVGVHGGYAFANYNEEGELFSDSDIGPELDGFVGGAQVGVNYQTGNFVLGIEADGSYADLESDEDEFAFGDLASDMKIEFLATVRGRVGYAFDNIMVYGTGGVSFAGYEANYSDGFDRFEDDETLTGYVVGVGVEGFVTENLTARIEYLFNNYSDDQFDIVADLEGIDEDLELHTHVVRGALNYKFAGF